MLRPDQPFLRWANPAGVAHTGGGNGVLQALGAGWSHNWEAFRPGGLTAGRFCPTYRAELDDWRSRLAQIPVACAAEPGAVWLGPNEPNFSWNPDELSARCREMILAIRAADPTAKIIGPACLFWDANAQAWYDAFLRSLGVFLDGHGLHTYNPKQIKDAAGHLQVWSGAIDSHMTQLEGFRSYLDGLSSERGKPILVSEMGMIHVDPAEHQGAQPLPRDDPRVRAEVDRYFGLLPWLAQNRRRLGLLGWAQFCTQDWLLSPAVVPILLANRDETLTVDGRRYAARG